jgi:hypothetical protein
MARRKSKKLNLRERLQGKKLEEEVAASDIDE